MRNLFILPRIHQNIVSELEGIYESGEKLKIISLNKSIYDKKFNTFLVKDIVFLSNIAKKIIPKNIMGELPNNGYIIPNQESIKIIFKSIFRSKRVFLRELRFPVSLISLFFIFLLRKDLIIKIQLQNKRLPLSYNFIFLIFKLFNLNIKINNALPFYSNNFSFVPFKKPRTNIKPQDLASDYSYLNLTSIGKLEDRKRILLPLMVARELINEKVFKLINLNIFITYKDKNSNLILDEIENYKKRIIEIYPNLKINIYHSSSNDFVLKTLASSHIYLHPANKEQASYSIIEAFSVGAFVLSQIDCYTTDYLPFENCSKKLKNFSSRNVVRFIKENFDIISSKKNREYRSKKLFYRK